MYDILKFEKIFSFLLAIGVCSVIAAAELKIGNYNVQQFIIIMPSLYMAINYLLIKKQKIQKSILLLIFYCFFSFLVGSFMYGISIGDFASLFGFIILPIMINIFINIKSRE